LALEYQSLSSSQDNESKPALRNVKAGNHVPGHAAMEFVAGDAMQLGEDSPSVFADVDIGKGFAPNSSSRQVALPVPAPISNVAVSRASPQRSHSISKTQSGYAGRAV
jgi:hypothetical protein